MVSVFLLTLFFDREQDLINTICIAAMLILVIHPPSLFSISFQLSFTAVTVIVAGVSLIQPVLPKPKGIKGILVNRAVSFLAVSAWRVGSQKPE